jgi:hypothetical protein
MVHRIRKDRWVCTTPFGSPVVPEVKRISALSSNLIALAGGIDWRPEAAEVGSTTSTPADARQGARPASNAEGTMAQRGPAARAMTSTSNGVRLASIGTAQPPSHHTASRSTKNSIVLL